MRGLASRLFSIAFAAVLCFVLLLPLAMKRHDTSLAFVVVGIFAAYVLVNFYLWMKLREKP